MRRILLCVLATAACKRDKAPDQAAAPAPTPAAPTPAAPTPTAPTPPAPTPPAPTPEPTVAPPASPSTLTCDIVLPPAIRARYLADAQIRDVEPRKDDSAGCVIVIDGVGMYSVGVKCNDDVPEYVLAFEEEKKHVKGMKDLPGVGKAAAVTAQPPLGNMVTAFDDDSPCKLTFTLPAKIDPKAFATEMLALLPIK